MPFRTLAGHRPVLGLLARAAAEGTLPPSLIFSGPDGVGKRRSALALAQALNCQAPKRGVDGFALDACGQCGACRRIDRGAYTDVLTVEPEESGNTRIHQVRDVIDRMMFRPFEGRWRVVIIDQADAMVDQAQNALLKTLEEPSDSSVLILVTARPDALLATVRSRCPRLRFGRLAVAEVAAVLERDHGCDPHQAGALAALSDGSLARALERQSGRHAEAREAAIRFLDGAQGPNPKPRLDVASQLVAGTAGAVARERLSVRLEALGVLLRDIELQRAGADDRLLANGDIGPTIARLAGRVDGRRAAQAYAIVTEALEALDRNASPKIVADWIALQV
jgi:DNA polymerase-3 subunit delta'